MKNEKRELKKAHCNIASSRLRFSKEELELARRQLMKEKKQQREAFIIKMETDKQLDWI